MAKFVKGDVVIIPFPFSDLTQSKRQSTFVITTLDGDDSMLCQMTSQTIKGKYAIAVDDNDFEAGGLMQQSNLRPNRIFTADTHIVMYRTGRLKNSKIAEAIETITL